MVIVCSPEARHQGGTPGLGAVLQQAGHAGQGSGTRGNPMVRGVGREGS